MSHTIPLPPHILALMNTVEQAGEEIYLVGGSLRDYLRGREPNDFDLAISCPPERTMEILSAYRVIPTGIAHGTVTVIAGKEPVEVTTFRVDGEYTDARHPDGVVFTGKIEEDLSRRDFTVNAMAYHPRRGIVDPFGGKKDLERRVLRAVREPALRFSEDALRIMRAFRFSAQLGFSLEEKTLEGIAQTKDGLARIAAERIASEFLRLLCSEGASDAIRKMIELSVLPFVTGEYRPSEQALSALAASRPVEEERLGVFFSEADPAVAAEIARRLRLSNKQSTAISAVCRGAYQSVRTETEARRLIADCGIYAPFAVRVSALLGRSPLEAVALVEENRSPCTIAELAVGGRDLISAGIEPRRVGKTLEWLLSLVLEDPSKNERDRLLSLAKAYHDKR